MSTQTRQEVTALIEKFLLEKYSFRYNCIANRVEFKRLHEKGNKVEILTDYCANSIRRELVHSGLYISKTDFYSLISSDFTLSYNPFKTYFDSLTLWSAMDFDYIKELASKVDTTNNELWLRCFKKWIVGIVACALDEKTINQTAIIFTGKQGIGKTTFLHNLMPKKLMEYYFEGTINPGNKDTLAHLSECLLINLDELENLTKKDAGSLKEIITKNSIRMRRPYGSINENFPRRASFCGSVNNKEFLKDTTGNRRFLCFEAISFDNEIIVDLNKVYAQALYLWRDNFQFWFDKIEIEEINTYNKDYQLVEPEEEALLSCFEPANEDDEMCEILMTTEIHSLLTGFCKLPNTIASIHQLGKALHGCGFQKRKRDQRQVWLVKPKLLGNKVGTG